MGILALGSETESPPADSLKLPDKSGVTRYSSEFIEDTYLHFSLEHILSNHYEFATYQLETTGEFSNPDRYTFSFNGNSYKWNSFSVDNHRIDDVFFPGSSMHKPMLFGTHLNLDQINSRIDFSTDPSQKDRIYLNWNQGEVGGRVPFADAYVNFFHGHNSGFQDAYAPIEQRKKTSLARCFAATCR